MYYQLAYLHEGYLKKETWQSSGESYVGNTFFFFFLKTISKKVRKLLSDSLGLLYTPLHLFSSLSHIFMHLHSSILVPSKLSKAEKNKSNVNDVNAHGEQWITYYLCCKFIMWPILLIIKKIMVIPKCP